MKKSAFLLTVALLGLSLPAMASKGYAADGLWLMLVIAGFLLLIAGILQGIDYLRKNGRRMVMRAVVLIRKAWTFLRHRREKTNAEHLDMAHA
ncbi:MAG TPA: hypothetical protein PLK82_09515 [Bacteroidales bacterium]|nr:hypothetical protein [Bacteroidales bacterium]